MQLVAYGAQDIYLTGNPQITFFKVVYRRHTNFSMEAIEQTINGSQGTTSGGSGTVTISRNGDLVHKIYVTSDAEGITDGSKLIVDVELEIGGQRIDRHYQEWMQIWNELSTPESKAIGLKSMQGCIGAKGSTGPKNLVQVPLQFWFCRNPGLALPLIALQYHEVKLKFNWGSDYGGGNDSNCKVICDYIYLDTDERRRFAQVSHEYLIEQVQRQTGESGTTTKLNFNHPVKELIWTSDGGSDGAELRLKLNGHDRFSKQQPEYFQLRQPYDYHTAVPAQNLPSAAFAAARAGTTTYDKIDNLLIWAADADGLGGTELDVTDWNALVHNTNDGTTSADTTATFVEHADTGVATKFISVGGTDDLIGIDVGSINVGDLHLVEYYDVNSAATCKSTITKVNQLIVASDSEVQSVTSPAVDAPVVGATLLSLDSGEPTPKSIIIEYEEIVIPSGARLEVGDVLSITKIADAGCRTSSLTKKINVYSFGLKPEEHQPSGTCNFSRIDVAQLIHESGGTLENQTVYAVNYNVLRIMSGMGGLAYSN